MVARGAPDTLTCVEFYNAYDQGFARIAACTLPVALADPATNAERTVAQLRAMSHFLSHLDSAADRRRAVQARRRRPDAEYFQRFPPYLVPTYPGDEELFQSPAFRDWLPDEPEIRTATLEEIMHVES